MNAPKTPDASDARLAGGLVRAAGIAVLLVVIAHTSADPDLWGHVRFGQDIIAAGQLPTNDSYSFTSDRPWINHEWLAEVLMAAAYAAGGARGLVALKALLAIGAIVLVTVLLRQRVPEGWHRAVLVAFTLLVGVAPLTRTMRPQVFSLVLFAALLVVISTAERSPRRWWLPPMFLVWANLHGAWLVGAGILVVWTAIRFIDKQSRPWRWHLVFVGLLSAAATLVNPYGLELWRFMFSTVGLERGDIVEWHAITQLPILLLPWGLTTLLALWAVWRVERADIGHLAVCGLLAFMSFQVARLIGFYALAVVVLLASAVRINPTYRADAPLAFRRAAGLLLGGVVVVAGLSVQALALACLRPSGALELDPAAAAYLQGHAVTGRMLVWFDWGEYAIWHLPHLSVSIDGRRETVYSKAIIADHDEFYRNGPKARSYLEQLDPDYVWLRPDLPVSSQLQTWGWTPLFESPRSTVWLRPGGSTPATRPATPLPSCFPGP